MTNNDSDKSAFASFSSTCYYYGESLSDELAAASADGVAPPIGLVHTSFGGSTIEQWLTNETIATCGECTIIASAHKHVLYLTRCMIVTHAHDAANASISGSNQEWHDQRVVRTVSSAA